MAVESQSEIGMEGGARRCVRPVNSVLGVRQWRTVPSICCTILRIRSRAVDADLYSGKKVMPLSNLLVMGVVEFVMRCEGRSYLLVV